MPDLRLSGPPAFSSFRREKLLASVKEIRPDVTGVQAYYEHFVDLEQKPSAAELATLKELLRYGPAYAEPDLKGLELLVIPRIGTVSPWSSKATDIARNCGLKKINRIERGIRFTFAGPGEFAKRDIEAVMHLVHDRMTETCFDSDVDMGLMFEHHLPAPLAFVPVNENGRAALEAANKDLGLPRK